MTRFKSFTTNFVSFVLVFSVIFSLCTSYTCTNCIAASNSKIKVYLNNILLVFGEHDNDPEPYIKDGRTLVPFRKIFESLGMEVSWNGTTRTVNARNEIVEMELYPGKNYAYVNRYKKQLDVAPEITDGRTFVPLRFVSESYGAEVVWEAQTSSVYVNYSRSNYKLGQQASYKGFNFSVDSLTENTSDNCIIVEGKTSSKDIPLIIELQDSTKQTYSRSVRVSGDKTAGTDMYQYTLKVYAGYGFKPETVFVKTSSEGIQPFIIAEYSSYFKN